MTERTKKVRAILVRRAKEHDMITFAALARKITRQFGKNLPPRNLGSMLDAIDKADFEAGRPSLACIVISAEKLVKPAAWHSTRAEWMSERRSLYRWYNR